MQTAQSGTLRAVVAPFVAILVTLAAMTACSKTGEPAASAEPAAAATEQAAEPMAGPVARATLQPLGDSGVSGEVTFTAVEGGVRIDAHVMGLSPGEHGFHIHEYGDCSSPDGKSAGGHFNPGDMPHGSPDDAMSHAGDLGNITADADGHAMLSRVSTHITLGDGPANILGRGVIVHEKTDDMTTQPTGAAGGRVACGVIMLEGGSTTPVLAPSE